MRTLMLATLVVAAFGCAAADPTDEIDKMLKGTRFEPVTWKYGGTVQPTWWVLERMDEFGDPVKHVSSPPLVAERAGRDGPVMCQIELEAAPKAPSGYVPKLGCILAWPHPRSTDEVQQIGRYRIEGETHDLSGWKAHAWAAPVLIFDSDNGAVFRLPASVIEGARRGATLKLALMSDRGLGSELLEFPLTGLVEAMTEVGFSLGP